MIDNKVREKIIQSIYESLSDVLGSEIFDYVEIQRMDLSDLDIRIIRNAVIEKLKLEQ